MTVRPFGKRFAIVRLELSPSEISPLLIQHAKNYPGGPSVEEKGRALIATDFEPTQSAQFVEEVCSWGRGKRLIRRIQESSSDLQISERLRTAYNESLRGDIAKAIGVIGETRGIGQSFASKILRFLLPDRVVILDSVIRSGLGYSEDSKGYDAFLADCHELLTQIAQPNSANPSLRICDIEAAIFAKLQGY